MIVVPTPPMPPVPNGLPLQTQVPVGTIIAFAGQLPMSSSPSAYQTPVEEMGWMLCDGRPLNKDDYPELYAALGGVYGDPSNDQFNIPDLRGYFLRGVDDGSGNDPDVSKRSKPKNGTGSAEGVGSTQDDALFYHEHNYKAVPQATMPSNSGSALGAPSSTPTPTTDFLDKQGQDATAKTSDFETRPKNVYVNYLIKVTYGIPLYPREVL